MLSISNRQSQHNAKENPLKNFCEFFNYCGELLGLYEILRTIVTNSLSRDYGNFLALSTELTKLR